MARTTRHAAVSIESLETREILSAGGPTVQAQYMLEVLNLVRTNPAEGSKWVREHADATIQANLQYYGVNLDEVTSQIANAKAQQPLAWNEKLASAAQQHSEDMAAKGYQSHDGSEDATRTPEQRIERAGYTNRVGYGENAFAYARSTGTGERATETAIDNAMQAFLIDWGVSNAAHRTNILEPSKSDSNSSADAGLGIADVTRADLQQRGFGPKVVTQVFGRQANSKAQIVGVVFSDENKDGRFSYREGRGDVEVSVENTNTLERQTLSTWDAGGYQFEVDPGTYKVSARSGRQTLGARTVNVGSTNVKVDFKLGDAVVDETPAPVVTTPTPTPVRPKATNTTPATATPRVTLAKLGFNVPSRTVTSTTTTSQQSDPVVTTPGDNGYAVAVNLTSDMKVSSSPTIVATQVEAQVVTAPKSVTTETSTPKVDQVVASGLQKDWFNSKVIWGQGWKAAVTDPSR